MGAKEQGVKRSCFGCKNIGICYTYKSIDRVLRESNLNIDGDDAPGNVIDVFEALGSCCLHHSPRTDVGTYITCFDERGDELKEHDVVCVQKAGNHVIYKKEDGQLYFKPYGKEERVSSYFVKDLTKVSE